MIKSAWPEFEKQQMAALMKLLKGPLWVWLTIGLIGLGLTAHKGYLRAHQGQAGGSRIALAAHSAGFWPLLTGIYAVPETTTPHQPNMLARRHWFTQLALAERPASFGEALVDTVDRLAEPAPTGFREAGAPGRSAHLARTDGGAARESRSLGK